MNFARAFTYIFDDRSWVEKLVIALVLTFITILLTPLLVGLLGWSALLGYQIQLVRNWRAGSTTLLPSWNDFGGLLNLGFYPLVAGLVYILPNLVFIATILVFGQNTEAGIIGGAAVVAFCCLLLPIFAIYNLLTLPMYALGMGRYIEDRRLGVFFEIGYLLVTVRDNFGLSAVYVLFLVIVNLIFTFVGAIPLIGWAIVLALGVPVYGALTAQYATAILGAPNTKRDESVKPKRRPTARR